MKTLLKNANVINVFTGEIERADVLIDGEIIVGVGDYSNVSADVEKDLNGKYVCPGFIDGHLHIESTFLTPAELAKAILPCGTTLIVTDPHEMANVCGAQGIKYMIEKSRNLPLKVYFNLPSCVPSTPFDESGAILKAKDLEPLYKLDRVLGLAEMMNYPGVINGDKDVLEKLSFAVKNGKVIDGHAPMLSGRDLDVYVSRGVKTDHECSNLEEAKEKIRKGQWIMLRQGTAARNLEGLLGLFDEPYCRRTILVTDDRHPADFINEGHIDNIIRLAVSKGKSVITAIQMATIRSAECFNLKNIGAIAPSFKADLLVLDDLNTVAISEVYVDGKLVVENKKVMPFTPPVASKKLEKRVLKTFNLKQLKEQDFYIENKGSKCRVIGLIKGELLTDELIEDIDFNKNNGIDIDKDVVKLAVIERHKNTSHKGVGFIKGIGIKKGAMASSVSHDSHNIICIGTNEKDMAIASNRVKEKGGNVVVLDGKVIAEMPLPIAGLISDKDVLTVAKENEKVRKAVHELGVPIEVEPFMNMAFVSLSVIPSLKMTTKGLIDVNTQQLKSLFVE